MEYIFAMLSIWLLFLGCIMTTRNVKSALLLKMPCFVFSVFVGIYSLYMTGLLNRILL